MHPLLSTRFHADAEEYAKRMNTAGRDELGELLNRLLTQERRLKDRAEEATGEDARVLRQLISENLRQQKEARRLMRGKR